MAESKTRHVIEKYSRKIDVKMLLFFAVIAIAIFLRVWHFSDWLFFKMDQARDATTIKNAFQNGPGYLPLLGPKAGGTNLNLGPFFYYFEYLATVIFQSVQPAVMAYPDLFFSILTIPLLYLFLKKYFNRNWSLILASAYALCFLGIEYSRFAWNPNSLPFFNLLFFFSLLNVFDGRVAHRYRWVILAGFSFAISTQLHFLSFLTLPTVTLLFLAINRKKLHKFLDWKKTTIFVSIIFLIYIPVFVHEFHTNFHNSQEFVAAIHAKASNHSLFDNILKDVYYFGQNWLIILIGYIGKSTDTVSPRLVWLMFILPSLYLNYRFFKKEDSENKKNFLLIAILWFVIYFLSYIPIAYDTRPRFFLPMLELPFIYAGFIAQFFLRQKNPKWKYLAYLIVIVIIISNINGTSAWFREIGDAQKKSVYPQRTIILKARDGIVLWHLENAAKYIRNDCSGAKAFYFTTNEYKRPVEYVLGLKGLQSDLIENLDLGQKNCVYGVVLTRSAERKLPASVTDKFDTIDMQKFGALTVFKLAAKDEFNGQPLGYKATALPEEKIEKKRVYWKDIIK